jgi:hypothetical protein
MLRKVATRLLLAWLFALIGLVIGIGSAPLIYEAGLVDSCPMGAAAWGMLVGSMLGSLFGCAIAVPRGSASTGRRILSFILSPAVAILVHYACWPLLDTIPPQYQDQCWVVLLVLILPAFSLFGFSIPVLLRWSRSKRSSPMV